MSGFTLILALVALAAVQTAPSATPQPAPIAAASAAPTSFPNPTIVPNPNPLPSASPSPIPTATPTATPTPLVLPAGAPPQIVDVRLNHNVIHSGDTISGTVTTSTNVASVEVRIASYSFNVPRTAFGQFALSYQAPHIPWFAHGDYTAQVIARNSQGASAERDVPIALR
jgi:hypothetical protein